MVEGHSIRKFEICHVEKAVHYGEKGLWDGIVLEAPPIDNSVPEYQCRCGKSGMDVDEALEHMNQVTND